MKKIASLVMALAFFGAAFAQSDIRLAVLEPEGKGIAESDRWVLSLVQGSIIGDFNKYSGMTVIDRQNLEKVFDEWEESESGKYSDENRVKIGNLTNASHILRGIVTKTSSAFMLEFSVTDIASGERKASYSPKPVSLLALEDLSAVKAATVDLLEQLGVKLTGKAKEEMEQAMNASKIQAETALARGIAAKRQGTEVAALSYFYQAAALDPSLLEATNRSSVMAANISSGNIGTDTRNDILWRRDWVGRLTEAEKFFDGLFKSNPLPYVLFYSTKIIPGDINYQTETQTLSINTNLRASGGVSTWLASVEKSLQAVYDGLEATKRKDVWGLQNWPWRGVTDLRPFESKSRNFSIVAELVGDRGTVIGKAEFQSGGEWRFNGYGRPQIIISKDNDMKLVNFKSVKADDISDRITIQIASVNGIEANTAAQTGVLQVKAIAEREWNNYVKFSVKNGMITRYNGDGAGSLVIPNSIWDESITSIGENAFSYKQLTEVTIPKGIKSIGERAFANNQIKTIAIGANVKVYENSFDGNFAKFYKKSGKAGTYNADGLLAGTENKSFIDTRDDKVYKIVKIGTQVWMAENLNYYVSGSKCYNDEGENCGKYGKLYSWTAATSACPNGWHLPKDEEWNRLHGTVGKIDFMSGKYKSGNFLKATSGWNKSGNGIDKYGFSALPGGFYGRTNILSEKYNFGSAGERGYWWSATKEYFRGSYYPQYWRMFYNGDISDNSSDFQGEMYSVRCVRD